MTAVTVERRVLAGIRFVDAATGGHVGAPLILESPKLAFARNRIGLFAVTRLRPETIEERTLAAHLDAFDEAPALPAAGSVDFAVTVSDPKEQYLPRRFAISLPRGDDWKEPIEVELSPAPTALLAPNWSGVRASLRRRQDGEDVPLVGARLTVIRDSDGEVLAHGFSDERGEVLVVVVGIQVIDFTSPTPPDDGGDSDGADGDGDGDDDAPEIGANHVATRIEIHTGPGDDPWPPDPAAIEAEGQAWEPVDGALPTPALRTGRVETADLQLLLQPET